MIKPRAHSITRRDFLSMGSAGVLAPVFLASSSHAAGGFEASTTTAAEPTEFLSVGYWLGSEKCSDLASLDFANQPSRARTPALGDARQDGRADRRVVSATGLGRGDVRLAATGARVTVHGLYEADGSLLGPGIEDLAAAIHFPVHPAQGNTSIPFAAWSYRRTPVRNASHAVGLNVPIDEDAGLRLTIERGNRDVGLAGRLVGKALFGRSAEAGGPSAATGEVRFTLGDQPRTPKLRRGVYFIASPSRPGRAPAWEQHRFDDTLAGRALVRYDLLGEESADFDYLVVSIDHAVADERVA